MKKIFLMVAILSMFVSSAIEASVGVVQRHSGSSFVLRNHQKIKVRNGLHLERKDRIQTARNAWVKLKLNDNTIINAGQNATLVIEEYIFTKKSDSKASFSFVKGLFRTITGRIGKVAPQRFKVHTPNATIGIRGTEFYVNLSKRQEEIFCTRGAIVVDSTFGEIEVKAGRRLWMNGKQYRIKKSNLKTIQKRIGIWIKKANIKEKELIKRSLGGVLSGMQYDPPQGQETQNTGTTEDGAQEESTEQENASTIDQVVPEIPKHNPCPLPE